MLLSGQSHAATESRLFLDGKELSLPEKVEIENLDGNVMIPIRVVVENLGFKVTWNQKSQSVKIEQRDKVVQLVVNDLMATVDGKQESLNAAPLLRKGSVVVPIRFVSEQMGMEVDWNNVDKVVSLITPVIEPTIKEPVKVPPTTGSGTSSPTTAPVVEPSVMLSQVNTIQFSENQLKISLSASVQPKISRLTGPDRIVLDLPNTMFSDSFRASQGLDNKLNGRLEVSGYPDVSGVRYSLFSSSPSTVRVVIDLNSAKKYTLLTETTDSTLITVQLREEDSVNIDPIVPNVPAVNDGRKKVVIDAGHGGSDPGATSISKKMEKDFTLAVALKVEQLLLQEPAIELIMTRNSDVYPTLQDRVDLANNMNADVFVSIHADSFSPTANGSQTFYYQRTNSKAFANVIHKYLIKATGFKDRGVTENGFFVIKKTKMPAVLLEVGFLSNSDNEALLFTEELQNKVAQGIVNGIKEYLGIK
ncbi:N-acetylmuramoyl-L-alanine amidase [Paenibacillus sp. DS2015]|uniref:N-acetylmuramoyl-L-alanine amidase n=1 Tax=Paenibacillus sp. DS2015 TaxID=3373917 RepID=UPI003D1CF477